MPSRNENILQSIIDNEPYDEPTMSRIEALLVELKEVIEQGGGGTTVDQTYSPTSENAQSGTAVAEALETIPSVTVDHTFDPASANAQSGAAVADGLTFKEASGSLVPTMTSASSQNFPNVTGNFRIGQLFAVVGVGRDSTQSTPQYFVFMFPDVPRAIIMGATKHYPVFYNGIYCCDVSFDITVNSATVVISNYQASTNFTFSELKLYALG